MKQFKTVFILTLILALITGSCKEPLINDCYTESGPSVTEIRPVGDFSEIIINGGFSVHLQQSDSSYVLVKSYQNFIDGVITRVDSSILIIEDDIRCRWIRSFNQENSVWIFVKDLKYIDFRGTGTVRSIDTLKGNESLVLEIHDGSGNLDLTIDYSSVYLYQHIAYGNVTISGICNTLQLSAQSLGIVDCRNLKSYKTIVNHSGSNSVFIYPEFLLEARVNARGNVYYKGNPLVKMYITGSGRLIPLDQD